MMTLEEAIKHCEEQAEKHCGDDCGMEHKQLAEYLIELQHYRNVWKDPSQKPKEGEIVLIQNSGDNMYIGEYFLYQNLEGVNTERSRGWWESWKGIDKWAYPKDVFPFSNGNPITLLDYSDGKSKISSRRNRELASHKAWEESLLIADRIRGY